MARNRGVLYPEGTTHPDQIARHFPVKLPKLNSVLIAALVLAVAVVGVLTFVSSRDSSPFTGVQSEPEVVPMTEVQPAEPQTAPAPVAKEWPKVAVAWQEVPVTPGVYLTNYNVLNDGFYTGTMNTPNGGVSTPEGLAFIATILPQLKEGGRVAAARDSVDKNIVFASIKGWNGQSYMFISIDGEKSWNELNLPPLQVPAAGTPGVRVKAEGDFIRLIARDSTVQEEWWATTIKKSDL